MVYYGVISALTGNIIAFVAGTALTWSSSVIPKLNATNTDDIPFGRRVTDSESSWIGSLLALGATFGPFIYGFCADKFGRKMTLTSLGVPFVMAYFLLAFTKDVTFYYVARVIKGLAVGGVFTVMPMYVGEISEDSNRGALGSSMNCFITAGLLFSYCVGPYVSIMFFNIILAVFPVIFMVAFMFISSESPYYLVTKGNYDQAEKSLSKLRGEQNSKELEEIKSSVAKAQGGSITDLYKSVGLMKALIISLSLVGFQQFSGINAVLFYAQTIFKASGSAIEASVCSIIIGSVQFGTSFLTPLVVERMGRKILLLISAVGMTLSEIPLGLYYFMKKNGDDVEAISWLPVVSLVLYIITYNVGFGPLPWAVMGEIFPGNVKSIASSMTAAFCWLVGFLITKFFQQISDAIGMGLSFWGFAVFCIFAGLFTVFCVIETRGKSLEEIQDLLDN